MANQAQQRELKLRIDSRYAKQQNAPLNTQNYSNIATAPSRTQAIFYIKRLKATQTSIGNFQNHFGKKIARQVQRRLLQVKMVKKQRPGNNLVHEKHHPKLNLCANINIACLETRVWVFDLYALKGTCSC